MVVSSIVDEFCEAFGRQAPLFSTKVLETRNRHTQSFDRLGSIMLGWARRHIGDTWAETLIDGYQFFVTDVNRSQMRYERNGHYRFSDYQQVNKFVYSNDAHMARYHWGVYVTTFAWEHHLQLFEFFEREFLTRLASSEGNRLLDLGAGSAVWSLLASQSQPALNIDAIDISPQSVQMAAGFIRENEFEDKVRMQEGDALTFRGELPFDFGISCFLLEHLEQPASLFDSLCANLKSGGFAFVTGALTASEVDHIFEFRRESELVALAENAGFRVIATYSCSPPSYPREFRFLPRSMALLCQKRSGDIW